jgi:ABC-type antimicrobial peptide transport system permease subunit
VRFLLDHDVPVEIGRVLGREGHEAAELRSVPLGAESLKILQLVAQQGFKLIGIGLVAGTVVALVCARFIEGMLYGVTAADPISLLIAVVVLCLAGGVACLLPALRAIRINPVTVLGE